MSGSSGDLVTLIQACPSASVTVMALLVPSKHTTSGGGREVGEERGKGKGEGRRGRGRGG